MELSQLYRACTKHSLEEDRVRILAGFHDLIKRARLGVRLVNYYKGLLLSYPATLVEVQHGILELDLHPQQAVALNATGYTFIRCDHFDSAILAQSQNVNLRSMAASLRDFHFVEIMAEQRRALRLELEPQTEALIKADEAQVAGKTVDISLEGLSILPEGECQLARGTEVALSLMVPNLLQETVQRVQVDARLVHSGMGQDGRQICRFAFCEVQSEGAISRYILQRQVAIIRELKEQI